MKKLAGFTVALFFSLYASAFAQSCNSASGFIKSIGTYNIGDIAIFGPDCNSIEQGGSIIVNSVPNISVLRNVTKDSSAATNVLGYYAPGDGGGGYFVWNSGSSATDNGGTIIASSLGGTGRWFRQTPVVNLYSPEMFGARHNGSDDTPFIEAAVNALQAVGGGTLWATGGYVYTLQSYSQNFQSVINIQPGVSYDGTGTYALGTNVNHPSASFTGVCSGTNLTATSVTGAIAVNDIVSGPNPGSGIAGLTQIVSGPGGGGAGVYVVSSPCFAAGVPLTTVKQFAYMMAAFAPKAIQGISIRNITLDYNGVGNSCGGQCSAVNGMIAIEVCDNILIDNVTFLHNSGSNNVSIGRNKFPYTCSNARVTNTHHAHNGDDVNSAAGDHSSIWLTADGYTLIGNTLEFGPIVNGAAFEMHGRAGIATGNTVTGYFNGVNLSNETTGIGGGPDPSYGMSFSYNNLYNVSAGVTVWGKPSSSQVNITVNGNNIVANPSYFLYYIDADGNVSTSGNNLNLAIQNNTLENPVIPAASSNGGINVGAYSTAIITGNLIYNSAGPCIQTTPRFPGAGVLTVVSNQCNNPSLTLTGSAKTGMTFAAAGTIHNANIQNNSVDGIGLSSGILSSLVTNDCYIGGNSVTGATTKVTNTGTCANVLNGYGAGVTAWLNTPSSANLLAAMTTKTGTGLLAFGTSPAITTPTGIISSDVGLGNVPNVDATNAANISSGILLATRMPALTGNVTSSVGTVATTLAAGNAANLNSGTLLAARMPALTGDVTTSAGAVATTLATGNAANLNSGTLPAARMPALTGDVTSTVGTVATTFSAGNASNLNSGTIPNARIVALPTDQNICFNATNFNTISAGNTYFFTAGVSSVEAVQSQPLAKAATFSLLQGSTNTAAGASGGNQTYTITVRKNGVDQALTCAMTNPATICSDVNTGHNFSASAGDLIDLKLVLSGTAASATGFNACLIQRVNTQ